MTQIKKIELFFLNTFLKICTGGVALVLFTDAVFFPEDKLSVTIDAIILSACILSYLIRKRYSTLSVLTITLIALVAMIYQCVFVPINTTTSLSIILVIGFIYSVLLKGRLMHTMHAITVAGLVLIFIIQYNNPELRFSSKANEAITVAVTYTILYFVLTFTTAVLKTSYDKIHDQQEEINQQLHEKATKIASQNEALLQIQNQLNLVNQDLEKVINERTEKIQQQNEILLKYSYTNAHHLRGPVARLLGLANIYKLEPKPTSDFIIEKMTDQAKEIDSVIKQINVDLEANNQTTRTERVDE